jgi:hypothetical protein
VLQIEGIYSSIQNLASGSLLTDIISGDFFDPNRNTYFCPNKSIKSQFGVNFYVPKVVTNNGRVNQLATSYNSALVNLYYLTPKSIMKTFFQNGEGFAYLSFLQNKSISSLLEGSIGEDGFSLLKNLTLANGNSILNDGGLSNEGIQALLENGSTGIITQILDNSGLQGEARVLLQKQLQKKFRSIVSLNKCHRFFSINARFKDLISKKIEGFMKKRREKLVQSLMKSKFFAKLFKEGAGKLLGQWAEKGGLQTIARALVLAAANALGIALSGGLANILVTGLSILVADALFAMGKLLLGMVVFAIFGIIGIGFLVFGKNNTFNQNTYTYASTPPGEVYVNPNFTGTSPITGEDDEHEIGDFVGGTLPDGEKCLLGSSSYRCTQGPYGSYSHANVAAVDVTGTDSFYAPTFCGKR